MNDNDRNQAVHEQILQQAINADRPPMSGDLRGSHISTKVPVSTAGRIVGTIFVIAAICVAGAYVYETWPHQSPKSVVADARLPSPAPR